MFAFDQPAAVAPAADPQQDVIEIVGTRPGQVLKIDRRTYQVNQTPNSAQKDTYQLLRGIPAVTIAPDDTIQLLGTPNVTVQIDGRPARAELLRTLHGSDIDKFEVITNPSAQYSAAGTGGIINLILRKKQSEGVSGTASLEGSTLGGAKGTASVKLKRGKWTYEADTWSTAGRQSRSTSHKLRSIEQVEGGPETINTEDSKGSSSDTRGLLHGKVTYELDPRTSLIAETYVGGSSNGSRTNRDFIGLTPDFDSFAERQRVRGGGDPFFRLDVALDHKGKTEGETLKANGILFYLPDDHRDTVSEFDNGDSYAIHIRNRPLVGAYAKIDWEHPLGKGRLLSMGTSWTYDGGTRHYDFESNGAAVSLGPDTVDQFTGSQGTLAAYATYQQAIGGWTFMPGLRVERGSWHISSPEHPSAGRTKTNLFPTLHVEHELSKTLKLTFGYSKRVDRPDLYSLRPFPIVADALTISQGNPDLKDQSTDSYEINLHYHRKPLDAGLIIYDRAIDRVWTNVYSVNSDGINVTMPINAGRQRDRGAEFDISTPILKRLKVSASLNLFASRVPVDLGGGDTGHRGTFRYTTNTTLEWNGPQRGKTPGDIAQLQVQTWSSSRDFQFRQRARQWVTLSYTHSFSPTLSLTGTAENLFMASHNRHRLVAPLVQEDYDSRDEPLLRIKLLKTFGKN